MAAESIRLQCIYDIPCLFGMSEVQALFFKRADLPKAMDAMAIRFRFQECVATAGIGRRHRSGLRRILKTSAIPWRERGQPFRQERVATIRRMKSAVSNKPEEKRCQSKLVTIQIQLCDE